MLVFSTLGNIQGILDPLNIPVTMMRKWLVLIITAYFLFSFSLCFAEEKGSLFHTDSSKDNPSLREIEVSVYAVREDAEKFAEKIKRSGFDSVVRVHETENGGMVYGVFVIVHEELPKGPINLDLTGDGGKTEPGPSVGDQAPAEALTTWKDLFSPKAGYFHAGLTVTQLYTDNAYETRTDKKSDFSTVLSPKAWLSVPQINQKPKGLDPISTRSPGGLALSREREDGSRRYGAFLSYQSDIPLYSKNSPSGNTTTHNVQGGLTYNFPMGLSLQVNNEFSRSYEILNPVLTPGQVDRFNSNLFYAIASFDTGNRLVARFDYSNFLLHYDAQRNELLNREDNTFDGYLFYKLWPKTSLFTECNFNDIGYDNNTALDSKEYNLFGGFQWAVTAKSQGSVKAGWGSKDFNGFSTRNFIFEVTVNHRLSAKSALIFSAFGKTDETNVPSTFYTLVHGFEVKYQHMLSYMISSSLDFSYTNESYGQDQIIGAVTGKRRDNVYQASVSLHYELRKWLTTGVSYVFTSRESDFPEYNYTSNTILVNVTGTH
jgi:hypothetical protein